MRKRYDDDDGRVIANMDVSYLRRRWIPRRVKADKVKPATDATKKEAMHIALNATLAALFIGSVMMIAIGLMILIMVLVW